MSARTHPAAENTFEITTRTGGSRADRIHFCRIERSILSIVGIPGLNTKYPDAFGLRRLDALALAQVMEDRIIARSEGQIEDYQLMRSVILRADLEVNLTFTAGNMLVVALAADGERSEVEVPIGLKCAVMLVYWLRKQFSQTFSELAAKDGSHRSLCDAIVWPEGVET